MNTILKYGILLGVAVVVWTFVMGFTGWYKHPVLLNLFYVVIVVQIALLVSALKQTAAQGRRYAGQVMVGTLISMIGGVLIFGGSLLFTTVVFPNYFAEITAIQEQMLRDQGRSEEVIRATMEMAVKTNTPMASALAGFFGTIVTGLLASLVIAGMVRAR
jgi:hypothetical protein